MQTDSGSKGEKKVKWTREAESGSESRAANSSTDRESYGGELRGFLLSWLLWRGAIAGMVGRYCWVPCWGALRGCHGAMVLLGVVGAMMISGCHGGVPLLNAIARVPCWAAIRGCHGGVLLLGRGGVVLLGAIVWCHCWMGRYCWLWWYCCW